MPTPFDLPDWELLLKSIAASPDDDLPRLVVADWLDEHGEPERAEFIRVQIEREKADRPELEWRERALWNNPMHGWRWAAEACPNLAGIVFVDTHAGSQLQAMRLNGTERVRFRRGFAYRVTCSAEDWLKHAAGVVPRQPVREVVLTRCDELDLARWWELKPLLAGLAKVELDTRSPLTASFVRDSIARHADVWNLGEPVTDVVIA